ncbi:SgcJ/EcaC family oxidoreductase [Nonomuraea sp. NPDC050556]|uniref:SgcJ/EcaC family oxidoreductase n=1 Tax=Nonomuraea sp. NPDC050556 TaxID=3364369 RepID=UPI0037BC4B89
MPHQINDLLVRLSQAWNDGDATAYAELFTHDADYITFFGLHMEGRAAIEESHRQLFDGPMKGTTMRGDGEPKIRHLSDDTALVISEGGLNPSVVTFTAVRQGDGWLFSSFQNTRKAQP